MQAIRRDTGKSYALNSIASCNSSLAKEPMVISDLHLLTAFHTWFMFPHFKFLQEGDSQSNRNGYQLKHMLERFFIMHEELKENMAGKWKTNPKFSPFLHYNACLTDDQKTEQNSKVDSFLSTCHTYPAKHCARYPNNLLPCALGGEPPCAAEVAKYLLGIPRVDTKVTYRSEYHGRSICLDEFYKFIKDQCSNRNDIISSGHLTQFSVQALQQIARGDDVWHSPHLVASKMQVQMRYVPIASNTQMTERGVKEGALCSTSDRGEISRSIYAVARSGFCEEAGNLAEGRKGEHNKEIKRDDRRRRTLKSQANVEMVMNQYAIIKQFQASNPEKYNEIERRARTYLSTRSSHFSTNRVNEKLEAFQRNMNTARAPNRYERLTGYDRTERSQGKLRITKLLKWNHEKALDSELEARGIVFDRKDTWTDKKNMVIENEANTEDPRYFKPRTSLDAFPPPYKK